MTFPTFEPSSRTYEHGEFPVSRHKFMTGRSQQLLHANKKSNQRLRLTYDNRPLKDFDYFLEHFNAQRGTHGSFPLTPNVLFAGWNNKKGDAARMGYDQRWRYVKEPRIRSRRGKYGSMEIELQTTENVLSYPTHDSDGNPLGCDPCATPIPDPDPNPNPNPGGGGGGDECPPLPPVIYPPAPPVNPPGPGGTDPPLEPDDDPNGPDSPTPTPSPGPGDPVAPPIICPFGSELVNGVCVPLPLDRIPRIAPLRNRTQFLNNIYTKGSSCRPFPAPNNTCEYRESGNYYWSDQELQLFEGVPPFRWEKRGEWNGNLDSEPAYAGGRCEQWRPTNEEVIYPLWVLLDRFDKIMGSYGPTSSGCVNCCVLPEGGQQSLYMSPSWTIVGYRKLFDDEFGPRGNYYEPLLQHPPLGPNLYGGARNASTANQRALSEPRAATNTPTNFPTHNPSRRRITYGDYEVDRFGQAQEVTMPLPSTAQKTDLVMQLVYANQPDSVARSFMDHYDEAYGNFAEFSIPAGTAENGTFAGWTSNKSVSKGKWLYARPPQIVTTHPGYSSTTIQLINIEPAPADKDNLLPIGLCPTDPGGGGGGGGSNPSATYVGVYEIYSNCNSPDEIYESLSWEPCPEEGCPTFTGKLQGSGLGCAYGGFGSIYITATYLGQDGEYEVPVRTGFGSATEFYVYEQRFAYEPQQPAGIFPPRLISYDGAPPVVTYTPPGSRYGNMQFDV